MLITIITSSKSLPSVMMIPGDLIDLNLLLAACNQTRHCAQLCSVVIRLTSDQLRSGCTGTSEALAKSSLGGLQCHAVFWAVLLMLSCTLSICHLLLTACPSLSGILLRNVCFGKVFYMKRGQSDVSLCILQRRH